MSDEHLPAIVLNHVASELSGMGVDLGAFPGGPGPEQPAPPRAARRLPMEVMIGVTLASSLLLPTTEEAEPRSVVLVGDRLDVPVSWNIAEADPGEAEDEGLSPPPVPTRRDDAGASMREAESSWAATLPRMREKGSPAERSLEAREKSMGEQVSHDHPESRGFDATILGQDPVPFSDGASRPGLIGRGGDATGSRGVGSLGEDPAFGSSGLGEVGVVGSLAPAPAPALAAPTQGRVEVLDSEGQVMPAGTDFWSTVKGLPFSTPSSAGQTSGGADDDLLASQFVSSWPPRLRPGSAWKLSVTAEYAFFVSPGGDVIRITKVGGTLQVAFSHLDEKKPPYSSVSGGLRALLGEVK